MQDICFGFQNKTKSRNKMKLLNNLKLTDIRGKIINTKDVKIKIKQKILNKKSIPKCQDKHFLRTLSSLLEYIS
jgi:hypothetical protein